MKFRHRFNATSREVMKFMAVRPFWVECDAEGYKNMVSAGPRNKDGSLDVTLYQRNEGSIATAFRFRCRSWDGKCLSEVLDNEGRVIAKHETPY